MHTEINITRAKQSRLLQFYNRSRGKREASIWREGAIMFYRISVTCKWSCGFILSSQPFARIMGRR